MATNTDKISLGVCDVSFGTATPVDLGSTKGGVEVQVQTETYEVKIDQYGETPVKDVIIGTMVTVTVPMAETDLDKLKSVTPQSVAIQTTGTSPTTVGVEVRSGVNTDLLAIADELKLHPTGKATTLTDEDFIAFKAAPVPNYTFKYATGEERVYEVQFKCYPDVANNGRIAVFGKESAA